MATPALAPIKPRAAVPRTSQTHFIEVDDWVIEELESNWNKVARKASNLLRGTKSAAVAKVR
jgi:predicted component of type VI protein secretion system